MMEMGEAVMINEEKLTPLDLVDVETLQRLQDALHQALGVSTGLADTEGKALVPHESWTDFCGGHIKKSSRGLAMCENCDKHGMISAMESGHVMTYTCHTGLTDFAAPIVVNGQAIGCFLGGQVATEPLTRDHVRKLARRYEIDEESLWEASKKIRIMSQEQVERAATLAYEVSNYISRSAYQRIQLQESNEEIEKVANMKSDFLANMSHEIRTPMNAVIGMAEMALREEMTVEAREYINQIIASGKTLLNIINDILDFSKIESGKMEIHEDEYELLSVVNDVANMIMTRIEEKPLELILDVDPTLPHMLYGDMIRINQVITNIANNAAKFTQKGKVVLKVSYNGISLDEILLHITVKDTGVGIKPADLKKLFQSFTQVDSKRNRNIEGTGLGLALSKQLVELMDGEIHVESEYGMGSEFSISIPQKVVDPLPSVVIKEKDASVAGLIANAFVEEQLQTDVQRLEGIYHNVRSEEELELMDTAALTHFFVDNQLFTERVQKFVEEHGDLKCVLVEEFSDSVSYDFPNLVVVKKPLYVMNIAQILNNEDPRMNAFSQAEDNFDFIAPDARILIVDDNKVNLTVAEGLLEPMQMNIDTATGGKQAIELITENSYDLILMDHMMPEIDGVETTRLIRRFHPDYNEVPILALTANVVEGTKKMFLDEGMNDIIAKPIEMRIMISKLKYWLPKEKIQKSMAGQNPLSGKEEAEERIKIDGLDTEYALELLGSEKLFLNVLNDYYQVIEKKANLIKQLEVDGDWPAYTIEVHALKSASRQIGAIELSDLAAAMEAASNARDIALVRSHSDEMLEIYRAFIEVLKPYVPADDEDKIGGTIERDELLRLFTEMQEAMGELDMDRMENAVHEMTRYDYDDVQAGLLERLKEANENIDVDCCEEVINEWRELV